MARNPTVVKKTGDPAIIVDLEWRDGVLYFVLRNISQRSVHDVQIAFRRKILGAGGQVDIATLPLWRNLTFVPPDKRIEVPIDRDEMVLAHNSPKPIAVGIRYKDGDGVEWRAQIMLSFEAYRDFPELTVR